MISGFVKFKLKGLSVWHLKESLEGEGSLSDLNPEDLTPAYKNLVDKLHSLDFCKKIALENIDLISHVVGSPLRIQRKPYMRILRPNNLKDSVGIHRDTHYGATPDEWVLWVPLTEAIKGGALGIIPGSHLVPDEVYPWVQEKDPEVERGSLKHWLGYMYAPKKMSKEVEDQCIPIPCKVGEAILFNTHCVHGSKVNDSGHTRVSVDFRLVQLGKKTNPHGIHGDNYEDL